MAKDFIFHVRMDAKEKETFFQLVTAAGYDNPAEYARQKLLVGEDMRAIEEFTVKLEKVSGILDGLQVIAGKVDVIEKAVSASSEEGKAAIGSAKESLQEFIEGAFSSLDFPKCHYKETTKDEGQSNKAFLLGVVLGVILAAGAMLIIK